MLFVSTCFLSYLLLYWSDFISFDLVFTSDPSMVDNLTHLAPLRHSHHEVLLWNFICYSDPAIPTKKLFYNFYKGDYASYEWFLN